MSIRIFGRSVEMFSVGSGMTYDRLALWCVVRMDYGCMTCRQQALTLLEPT